MQPQLWYNNQIPALNLLNGEKIGEKIDPLLLFPYPFVNNVNTEKTEERETEEKTGTENKETEEHPQNENENFAEQSEGNTIQSMSNCENASTRSQPPPASETGETQTRVEENSKIVRCSEKIDDTHTNKKSDRKVTHPFFNRGFRSAQTDPQIQRKPSTSLKPKLKTRFKAKPSPRAVSNSITNYFNFKTESVPDLNLLGHVDHDRTDPTDIPVSTR